MNRPVIHLDPNVVHFKEIFFQNGQSSIIKNDHTRRPLQQGLFFLLLTAVLYWLSFTYSIFGWLALISLLVAIMAWLLFALAAKRFFLWKNEVDVYLSKVQQIKKATLLLRTNTFELELNERVVIQNLQSIKKVDIDPLKIYIQADDENYYFPSKAMTEEEYKRLVSYLRENITQR